jgi:aspyridone synthetase trans-acting enoyl reductase
MIFRSGLKPITTCSPGKFEHVKSLGAVEAFDYRSPSCASDIRTFTHDNLEYVLDCITESSSMKICYAAIGSHGGNYIGLDQFPIRGHTRRDVRPGWVLAWTALGKPVDWRKPYRREARPKDKAFAERWAPIAQKLLDSKDIVTHPTEVSDEGLAGVAKGAERVKMGTAGGKKLIYRVAAPSTS